MYGCAIVRTYVHVCAHCMLNARMLLRLRLSPINPSARANKAEEAECKSMPPAHLVLKRYAAFMVAIRIQFPPTVWKDSYKVGTPELLLLHLRH